MIEEELAEIVAKGVDATSTTKIKFILYYGSEELELETSESTLSGVKAVAIKSDFLTSVSDTIEVQTILPYGDYVFDILPNKDDLYMHMLVEYHDGKEDSEPIKFKRLLACYIVHKDNVTNTTEKRMVDKETLNQENPMVVNFVCYDIEIATLKKIPSQLNVKTTNVQNAIIANFTHYVERADIKIDGQPLTIKTEMVEPDNKVKIPHIVIDQSEKTDLDITTLPFYIQDKYGVYNGGLGSYYQNHLEPTVYISPLLDPRRYEDLETLKIDCYVNPNYREADNAVESYCETGGSIKIMVPSIDKMEDDGEKRLETKGKAIAYRDNEITRRSPKVTISDKEVTNADINKFKVQSIRPIENKPAKVKVLGGVSNAYAARSEILMNEARTVSLTWRNSCPFIIKPNMPIKIHYEKVDDEGVTKIRTYLGNVVMVNTFYRNRSNEFFPNSEIIALVLDEEESYKKDVSKSENEE